MKKILIPAETFNLKEKDSDDKIVERKGTLIDFLTLIIRSCPSSKGTLDRIFDVGALAHKLKDAKEELILDNDDYKLISGCVLKELFEPWKQFQVQGSQYTPTGWDTLQFNPLHDTIMAYLKAVKDAEEYSEAKKK